MSQPAAAIAGTHQDRVRRFPLGARVTIAELARDPYPIFRELREAEPVTWSPAFEMWLVTRRADVARVLADWERFTTDSPKSTIRDIFGSHMLTTDGPGQIRHKRRFVGPFRRGRLEATLRTTVDHVLSGLVAELTAEPPDAHGVRRAELRGRLARPLSVGSICRVLGLPDADADRLVAWYGCFAAALENFAGDAEVRRAGKAAAREFATYVTPFLAGDRDVPAASMIGALRREDAGSATASGCASGNRAGFDSSPPADDQARPLERAEMVANLLIVLFGGIETTESMIGNALWAALRHPAVAGRLADECGRADAQAAESDFVAAVIDESMRWEPAVQSCTRFTTGEVELRGVGIPADETVQCLLGAANRDPRHFPDPDRFDPARPNARDHLAFGAGRHFCLGASMARIEAERALRSVFARLPGVRLDAGRAVPPHGHEFRAPPTIWVRWG